MTAHRFEVRAACSNDFEALASLSEHLNTVNLPDERDAVRELLEHSTQSFQGSVDSTQRKLVFLVWDTETNQAVGTSSVIAKLGRRDAPYIYLDVLTEEKYHPALKKHFKHTVLRIAFSYDGPTELGGLVVHPQFRGHELGRLVSYARFLYIAAHRGELEEQLLAELLPPLTPDGRSHLWDALGKRFTHMTYAEADLLSSRDKDFIRDLFPSGIVYATVLTEEAQAVIGKVGQQTKGVQHMLERLGFRYARRVDPFDGGPHFTALTDNVPLIKNARQMALSADPLLEPADAPVYLVGHFGAAPPYATILPAPARLAADGSAQLPAGVVERLKLSPGDTFWCTPYDPQLPALLP